MSKFVLFQTQRGGKRFLVFFHFLSIYLSLFLLVIQTESLFSFFSFFQYFSLLHYHSQLSFIHLLPFHQSPFFVSDWGTAFILALPFWLVSKEKRFNGVTSIPPRWFQCKFGSGTAHLYPYIIIFSSQSFLVHLSIDLCLAILPQLT